MFEIELLHSYLKKYFLPIILAAFGLIFISTGLIIYLARQENKGSGYKIDNSDQTKTAQTNQIVVDIEGGITKPGVYKVAPGTRIGDIINVAGGFSIDANKAIIEKQINLAAKAQDSGKIYIPRLKDTNNILATQKDTNNINSGDLNLAININTASLDELDSLPGIGNVTANKIINNRTYSSVEDLLTKKIVSQKVYSQIKDKIAAY